MGVQELESAMGDLFDLATGDAQDEARYQAWFEKHQVVMRLFGYERVIPHPILLATGDGQDEEFIPDFMGQRSTGVWEIVEIKRPDTALLRSKTRRKQFYQTFQSYISQCREYSAVFSDSANRSAFEARYSTSVQSKVKCLLIAGKDEEHRAAVHDLIAAEPLLEFLTYEEVFAKLEASWRVYEGESEDWPGAGLHLRVLFPRIASDEEFWILDLGVDPLVNRLSVVLKGETVHVRVLDAGGSLHEMRAELGDVLGRQIYFGVEIGLHPQCAIGRVWIDDRIRTARWVPFEFPVVEGMPFVIGSDMTGAGRGDFFFSEYALVGRVLKLLDRIQMRKWMRKRAPKKWLHFQPGALCYTKGHPWFPSFQTFTAGGQEIRLPVPMQRSTLCFDTPDRGATMVYDESMPARLLPYGIVYNRADKSAADTAEKRRGRNARKRHRQGRH